MIILFTPECPSSGLRRKFPGEGSQRPSPFLMLFLKLAITYRTGLRQTAVFVYNRPVSYNQPNSFSPPLQKQRRLWYNSAVAWSGIEAVITGLTRNQFAGFPARGFESHPLRQISVRKGAFSDSGGAGREEKHRLLRYMIEPDLTWKGRERK